MRDVITDGLLLVGIGVTAAGLFSILPALSIVWLGIVLVGMGMTRLLR